MSAPPVQYVTTSDGFSIAYGVCGAGEPIVWMPHFFSHIEIYWAQQTFIRSWLEALAGRFRLIQYDGRGQGMSSRGLRKDHSLFDQVRDLEAVVDRLRLERFVLNAVGWSGHVAVQYAIANPQRVRALVLEVCPIAGVGMPMAVYEQLASQDWERFIRNVAAQGQPGTVSTSIDRLKQSTNQDDYLAIVRGAAASDIGHLLARLQTPTLVLHPRDFFAMAPEESMKLAAAIPSARLALTDGATSPGDARQGLKAIEDFLAQLDEGSLSDTMTSPVQAHGLSPREIDVLHLLAAGKSNQQIADELVISLNTVNRHVSNIYAKTGAANRAEATGYAHRNGLVG